MLDAAIMLIVNHFHWHLCSESYESIVWILSIGFLLDFYWISIGFSLGALSDSSIGLKHRTEAQSIDPGIHLEVAKTIVSK